MYARPLLKSTCGKEPVDDGFKIKIKIKIMIMIDSEWVRKIRLIFQAAGKLLKRSRMGGALLAGLRATVHSFGRVFHQLWLEVTGFTFLAIAGIGAISGMREYGKYQSGHATGPGRLLLAVCFTVSFTWFGLSSFWRIKRKKLRAKAATESR